LKEGGDRVKVAGSKNHAKLMGVYHELAVRFEGCPVYRHSGAAGSDDDHFLYFLKKQWRVSSVVGKVKSIISTTSPAKRPYKVQNVSSHARNWPMLCLTIRSLLKNGEYECLHIKILCAYKKFCSMCSHALLAIIALSDFSE
jgi:hypothetical protein